MANTLTALIPDFYKALDVVGRELSGFLPAITLDADVARAAVGQNLRSPVSAQGTAEDVTPGSIPPDTGDQAFGNEPLTIEKSRCVPFRWTGEEQRGLNNGGAGYLTLKQMQIAQAIRVLINEMEAYIGAKVYKRASRAYGTAATTPFAPGGAGATDLAQVLKILVDNGCPTSDLQCVVNTAAGVNIRSVPNLYKVNEAGTDSLIRQGILGDLYGFAIRESAGIATVVKGTGASYLLNGALAQGATLVNVDTGTGTILAGDVLALQGDTNKYVVKTALAAGALTLNNPGVLQAEADNNTVTVGNSFVANMAFHRSAIVMGIRAPAVPEEGDMADDSIIIQDPRTGIPFEIRMYKQYRRVRYEVCVAYGGGNIKSEHSAILLG